MIFTGATENRHECRRKDIYICATRVFTSKTRAGGSCLPSLVDSWAEAVAHRAVVWIVPILPSLCCCISCLELSMRNQRLTLLLQLGSPRLREGIWAVQHQEAEGGLGIEPSLPWSRANTAGSRPSYSPKDGAEGRQTWCCWWKRTPRAKWHLFQYSNTCRLGRFRTSELLSMISTLYSSDA